MSGTLKSGVVVQINDHEVLINDEHGNGVRLSYSDWRMIVDMTTRIWARTEMVPSNGLHYLDGVRRPTDFLTPSLGWHQAKGG